MLAAFPVTTAADSGLGSLRSAIALANALPGPDEITFAIGSGAQTINLLSALPTITDPVSIDGTTQPGFSGQPIIELNGESAGFVSGLTLDAGNTTIRGLVINRFSSSGIDVFSNNNVIVGNYIGLNLAGNAAAPNGLYGVNIDASSNNRIGGVVAADRNVISGSGISGVYIDAPSSVQNQVQGNYIGTNAQGTAAIGNGFDGVEIFNGGGNVIGGTAPGAGNVLSGNLNSGVGIAGPAATGNRVEGNLIGTTANGLQSLGNAFNGVSLDAGGNTIGGIVPGARNTISGNEGTGIYIATPEASENLIQGNFIGVTFNNSAPLGNTLGGIVFDNASNNTVGGTSPNARNLIAFNLEGGILIFSGTGNALLGNEIFANAGLGINLATVNMDNVPVLNGVTPNDLNDVDAGANDLQNFPVLTSVFAFETQTRFIGSLQSTPNANFRIEFFGSVDPDSSTNGEGQFFLAAINVATNANGVAEFDVTLPVVTPRNRFITATATNAQNSTSEFSARTVAFGPTDPQGITGFLVAGPGANQGGQVVVYDEAGQAVVRVFQPYGAINIPIRVASADFNDDGIADIVTAAGPGGGPHIRVFDGATGDILPGPIGDFFAYSIGFTGGVYVAVGDVDNDSVPDIITGADSGGGPHVKVFSGVTGAELQSFFPYNIGFTGGVRVAAGDIDGDSHADIITAAGPGGGPHIRVFSGATGVQLASPIGDFFAYALNFTGGVYVSAGNFNGGNLDIVTGAGEGGGPHVKVFDGDTGGQVPGPIGSLFPYAFNFTGGVRVATTDLDVDGVADLVTAAGPGGGPHVRIFNGATGAEFSSFFPYAGGYTGGVFVAGSLRDEVGSPLRTETAAPVVASGGNISSADAAFALDGLLARLGVGLLSLETRVTDLPTGYLGAFADGVLSLDINADGYGWFVDSTPWADEEFETGVENELLAVDTRATDRIDLLSVLAHELGHALGLSHAGENDDSAAWMSATLKAGTRRLPSVDDLDRLYSSDLWD